MNLSLSTTAKNIIAQYAPLAGSIIGGPAGAAVGALVSKALGTPTGDSQAAEAALVNPTPDQVIALRKLDDDLQIQLAQTGGADMASARARQIALKDNTPRYLAYGYSLGFFAVLFTQFYLVVKHIDIDPNAMRLIDTATGVLFAMMMGAKEFYFGSNATALKQGETIAEIAKQP